MHLETHSSLETCEEEKEGAPLGVSSKGGAPSIERSLFQVIVNSLGDSST